MVAAEAVQGRGPEIGWARISGVGGQMLFLTFLRGPPPGPACCIPLRVASVQQSVLYIM